MSAKSKRWYFVILIASGLALAADRLWLSTSLTAPATVTATDGLSGSATPPPVAEFAMPELPFPRGIVPLDPRRPIVDLFAPPDLPASEEPDAVNTDKPVSASDGLLGQSDHATFEAEHRLKAVWINQRLKIANVDGQWMRIGKSLDGCRLTGISGREVRFECYDNEAVLELNVKPLRSSD